MDKHCPYCGISVAGHLRCPLCDTRLVGIGTDTQILCGRSTMA
jgi:uncharacterized Zn finger protein (UPF0148 family)